MALSVTPELDELDSFAGPAPETALAAARRIADSIAGPVARIVDRDARFPIEAMDALRSARLLDFA